MTYRVIETFDDVYWQSCDPVFKQFRAMKELADRQQLCAALRGIGVIVNENIFVFRMTPTTFLDITKQSQDPKDYPPSKDMILGEKPFTKWQNNPGNGPGVGAAFPPLPHDTSLVSSTYTVGGVVYKKLFRVAQQGEEITYYADWSLDGMIPMWVAIASVKLVEGE